MLQGGAGPEAPHPHQPGQVGRVVARLGREQQPVMVQHQPRERGRAVAVDQRLPDRLPSSDMGGHHGGTEGEAA